MSEEDIALVKRMVRPFALAVAGPFIAPRVLAGVTEENIRTMYREVGEDGIRQAAEAIIRIGKEG